ncbi:MAG TPA: Uma2 family endonuclease [Thermoanaerobaculia bacterium]|jgi:Uma2 family endonuclease
MAVPSPRQRLSIDEFQRMTETGVFSEDERLELIRGELVEMSPIGGPHATAVRRLTNQLTARLGPRVILDVQNPLLIREHQSELYPDLMLLRPREDFYSAGKPTPRGALLVIEVADSSLSYDRDVKIPLYAESGIPEAWLVDLNSGTVFVYRQPSPERYQEVNQYRRGDAISPEAFPEARFAVDEILG